MIFKRHSRQRLDGLPPADAPPCSALHRFPFAHRRPSRRNALAGGGEAKSTDRAIILNLKDANCEEARVVALLSVLRLLRVYTLGAALPLRKGQGLYHCTD